MAGRAHAAGYRTATTLFGTDRPDVRLVVADTNTAVADDTAKRYGYDRAEYDWHAIADAPDIDAVSVVVANHLHREIVEGLLAAGSMHLCEKPLAGRSPTPRRCWPRPNAATGSPPSATPTGVPHGRGDPARAGRRHAGRAGALQRPLLVRLRVGSDLTDHLAVPRWAGHRGTGRRRQPPARPF